MQVSGYANSLIVIVVSVSLLDTASIVSGCVNFPVFSFVDMIKKNNIAIIFARYFNYDMIDDEWE